MYFKSLFLVFELSYSEGSNTLLPADIVFNNDKLNLKSKFTRRLATYLIW